MIFLLKHLNRMRAATRRSAVAFEDKSFKFLWIGQTASAVGDSMIAVGLVFAVFAVTGSAAAVGYVLAALLGPEIAFVLLGGVLADRLPRRRIMIAADLTRAATQAAVAALLLTHTAHLWLLLVLASLYGAATAFFNPALTGLLPEVSRPEKLQQANALIGISRSTMEIVGPAVAGLIIAVSSAGIVFVVDALSFLASALALSQIHFEARVLQLESIMSDLRHGFAEVRARSWVWASIAYFAVWNLAFAPFLVLGPLIAIRSLGGASAWGAILAAGAIGSLIGALFATRLSPRRPLLAAYLAASLCALPLLMLSLPAPVVLIAGTNLVAAAAVTFAGIMWMSSLQSHIPARTLSRVAAYDWLGSLLFQPIGFALSGPVAQLVGVRTTLVGAGVLLAGVTVAALATVPSIRRMQPATRVDAELV